MWTRPKPPGGALSLDCCEHQLAAAAASRSAWGVGEPSVFGVAGGALTRVAVPGDADRNSSLDWKNLSCGGAGPHQHRENCDEGCCG